MDICRQPMYTRRKAMPPYTPSGTAYGNFTPIPPEKEYMCVGIDNMPLAMAYVPFQKWTNVMDAQTGFTHGSIFQDLILPFYGDKRRCEMRGDRF